MGWALGAEQEVKVRPAGPREEVFKYSRCGLVVTQGQKERLGAGGGQLFGG